MLSELNGNYAFRFNGLDDSGRQSYFLIGVGVMTMNDGCLVGSHRSALIPMEVGGAGPGAREAISTATFSLDGNYKKKRDGIWELVVLFTCKNPAQVMRSTFAFVQASPNTLWLAALKSAVLGEDGKFHSVAELAMGEATRLG